MNILKNIDDLLFTSILFLLIIYIILALLCIISPSFTRLLNNGDGQVIRFFEPIDKYFEQMLDRNDRHKISADNIYSVDVKEGQKLSELLIDDYKIIVVSDKSDTADQIVGQVIRAGKRLEKVKIKGASSYRPINFANY